MFVKPMLKVAVRAIAVDEESTNRRDCRSNKCREYGRIHACTTLIQSREDDGIAN